jgi:hypothetical protein
LFASVETSQIARDPDSDAAEFAFSRLNAIVNIAQLSKMNLIWLGCDQWCRKQDDLLSRPVAIRRLVEIDPKAKK